MKHFAIRRLATSFMTLIIVMFFAPLFTVTRLASDKKPTEHHKITPQNPASNGVVNPAVIPDYAAQEVFLRSLIAKPEEGEAGKRRVRAFAKESGLTDSEIDEVLIIAQNFVSQVNILDKQVKTIKDQHWPNPSEAIIGQLHVLQTQKLQFISNAVGLLDSRLGSTVNVEKIQRHIREKVKGQMSSFTPPHLGKQQKQGKTKEREPRLLHAKLPSFAHSFVAPAKPVQLMSEGYTYTNSSSNISALEAYSYGATVESYSSFGHEYRITVTTWFGSANKGSTTYPAAPDYSSPFLDASRTVSLNQGGGSYFDGYLNSTTYGTGFCPVSLNTFSTSSSSDGETIQPYVQLSAFTSVTPAHIAVSSGLYSDKTTATVSYIASVNASGTFDITPGAAITQGPLVLGNLTTTPSGTGSVTVGSGSFTIDYQIGSNTSGKFKPSVRATNPSSGLQLIDPTLISSSVEVQVHTS